jgi:hypothetical protein
MFWPKSIANVKEGEFALEGVALESRRVSGQITGQTYVANYGLNTVDQVRTGGQVH